MFSFTFRAAVLTTSLLAGASVAAFAAPLERVASSPPAIPRINDGLGKAASSAEIAAWKIDVEPDGKNLPPGSGAVSEGSKIFAASCASCHGAGGSGGIAPRLVGGVGTLDTAHPIKTVGSYWPYATTVFDYIRRAMPFTHPQSLTNDQVYALVAYILHQNKIVSVNAVMDKTTLPAVKMPNRNGFILHDPRPDVNAKACMSGCP